LKIGNIHDGWNIASQNEEQATRRIRAITLHPSDGGAINGRAPTCTAFARHILVGNRHAEDAIEIWVLYFGESNGGGGN
jgi:hypothetical protein